MSSIQKLLRSFRSTLGRGQDEVNLQDEMTLYRKRAEVALREERYNDALVFLAKVLRLNPYDLQARMAVAEIYHHALGEEQKAILTYEKVIATAGYDESNSYCVKAREGIQLLTAVFESAALPLHDLLDGESLDEAPDHAESVAG